MTGFLPPGMSCSAFWYAQRAGLLTGNGDLEFLECMGLRAARLARGRQLRAWKVPEGPFYVHMWPEWVWDAVVRQMADDAERFGSWDHRSDEYRANGGYWDPGQYE